MFLNETCYIMETSSKAHLLVSVTYNHTYNQDMLLFRKLSFGVVFKQGLLLNETC